MSSAIRNLAGAARRIVTGHPAAIVMAWVGLTGLIVALAPDLNRLAAEGQARLLPERAESASTAELIKELWPDQWYESLAVLLIRRPVGLTTADDEYTDLVDSRLRAAARRPGPILRFLGPGSPPEIASRLIGRDRQTRLILVPLSTSFVAPITREAIDWLESKVAETDPPEGLKVEWTGDAVIGRSYMDDVQLSLDRAAIVTVFLLLGVLLAVYRSPLLSLIPLATIGVSLGIARGVLGWMAASGWEVSPLVELFLVVVLFGCGTDFCLLISWRFGENWHPGRPASAMTETLRHTVEPLLSSAGTVIVGLMLMGTTRFKLFSSTGPSVAIGLAITLLASLTLTPALLILLARYRPVAFRGLTRPSPGTWDEIGRFVLRKPGRSWAATVLVMVPVSAFGFGVGYVQDMFTEMPVDRSSVAAFREIAAAFGPGEVAPLTVLIRSTENLGDSEGLALIDDLSRLLSRQRRLAEVRSATQPLGSTDPLEPARLNARLAAVNDGFAQIKEGAETLREGLVEGVSRLRLAMTIQRYTGVDLTGSPSEVRSSLASGLGRVAGALLGGTPRPPAPPPPMPDHDPEPARADDATDPRALLIAELAKAAEGAGQIAEGAALARSEVSNILDSPVGRHALDRLLITRDTIRENPDLGRALQAYLSPDGKVARIDLVQAERIFSTAAMRQVLALRQRVRNFLDEQDEVPIVGMGVTGANAESADIWVLTRRDQYQTWIVVPLGVFFVLVLTLRDVWACVNLVATMVLTYGFALGVTRLVFVTWLGADGLDWKVPLFLFVLLVAVGVDYNIFLMTRLQREVKALGLRSGIRRAVAQTGGLISSAAMITAASFASFLSSPLTSIRQLGFALVVGITVDALLVRPVLVPCGHWLLHRRRAPTTPPRGMLRMHAPERVEH